MEPPSIEPIKITITLPSNIYFMTGIRDFTLSLVKNLTNLSEQWAYRFQAVVDELCNNAIEYGSAQKKEIKVTFTTVPGESIEITVEDTGTGKNRMAAEELQNFVAERRKPGYAFTDMRGRGLSKIVSEWTNELRFEDVPGGGIKVSAKKYLKESKPEFAESLKGAALFVRPIRI